MFEARERIVCRGHRNVRATHPTTFEVTREETLTPAGDCIIGVGADKGPRELDEGFKEVLRTEGAILATLLKAGTITVEIHSQGHPALPFDHTTDLVWRRSGYICGRTIGIRTDRTARTLPRELIANLRREETLVVELHAFIPGRSR